MPTPLFLSAAAVVLHLALSQRYGFWGQELYYLALGERLAGAYVDTPPLIAYMGLATRIVFGNSIFAVRLPAALAAGLLVWLSARLCGRLGGDARAQGLTALSVFVCPVFLSDQGVLAPAAFAPVFWTAAILFAARILVVPSSRAWLEFSLLAGIGSWVDPSLFLLLVLFPLAAVRHGWMSSGGPWLALAAGSSIVGAHLVARHSWGFSDLLLLAVALPPFSWAGVEGVVNAILVFVGRCHPVLFPIWAAGMFAWILAPSLRSLLPLGASLVAIFGVMLAAGDAVSPAAILPALVAAGAVFLCRWAERPGARRLQGAVPTAVVLGGVLAAPCALPVLPADRLDDYEFIANLPFERAGYGSPIRVSSRFAEMRGWPQMVGAVHRAYESLPLDRRALVGIHAIRHVDAAAIDYLGERLGLPRATSDAASYAYWEGPRDRGTLILIGDGVAGTARARECRESRLFERVECAGCADGRADGRATDVVICHREG